MTHTLQNKLSLVEVPTHFASAIIVRETIQTILLVLSVLLIIPFIGSAVD